MDLASGLPFSDPFDVGGEDTLIALTGEGANAYLNADSRTGTASNGKISLTIDQAAVRLTGGEGGWTYLGGAVQVSYAFRASEPVNYPTGISGFSRFSSAQISQTELALAAWSDAARITFVRVGSGTSGDSAYSNFATMLFSNYDTGLSGSAAFSYYPGSMNSSADSGDVWVNSTLSYNNTPVTGGYGGLVLIHEIGHAIGLAHPSDYNATTGSTLTYEADASYYEDSRQYTVMSYFSASKTGGMVPGYSAAPLLDDIAAIQMEYGANMSTRTGDTVYGFHSNAGFSWFSATSATTPLYFAVWDAGGNDTFDFSEYRSNQIIDLRPGYFSDVGGYVGNVAIAMGADIENAIGGYGSDQINGNRLDNRIEGGGGNDTLMGGDGADTLTERSGDNYIRGDSGNDSLQGGAGFDDINGNQGNDTAQGGSGNDWVVGGKDNDLLYGQTGDDIVYGNMGNDTLYGDEGNDTVRGGQGDDIIYGGTGNDWLSGDRGDDTLTGGGGADVFNSFGDAGIDRVLDFNRSEGDRIRLEPGSTYDYAQVGSDVVITVTGGATVILVGVSLASLTGDWMI